MQLFSTTASGNFSSLYRLCLSLAATYSSIFGTYSFSATTFSVHQLIYTSAAHKILGLMAYKAKYVVVSLNQPKFFYVSLTFIRERAVFKMIIPFSMTPSPCFNISICLFIVCLKVSCLIRKCHGISGDMVVESEHNTNITGLSSIDYESKAATFSSLLFSVCFFNNITLLINRVRLIIRFCKSKSGHRVRYEYSYLNLAMILTFC